MLGWRRAVADEHEKVAGGACSTCTLQGLLSARVGGRTALESRLTGDRAGGQDERLAMSVVTSGARIARNHVNTPASPRAGKSGQRA